METLKNYIESKFCDFPRTQEILDIKANILISMEDKYADLIENKKTSEEALEIVLNQFGDITELKEALNITSSGSFDLISKLESSSSYFQKPFRAWVLSFSISILLLLVLFWSWNTTPGSPGIFAFALCSVLILCLTIHILSGDKSNMISDNLSVAKLPHPLIPSICITVFNIATLFIYTESVNTFSYSNENGHIYSNDENLIIIGILYIFFAIIIPFFTILISSGRLRSKHSDKP